MAVSIPLSNEWFCKKHWQFWPIKQDTKFAGELLGNFSWTMKKKHLGENTHFFSQVTLVLDLSRTMAIVGPRGRREPKSTTQQITNGSIYRWKETVFSVMFLRLNELIQNHINFGPFYYTKPFYCLSNFQLPRVTLWKQQLF